MMIREPDAILHFWLDEIGASGWFSSGAELDSEIRRRFGLAWRAARGGAFAGWEPDPAGSLALLILTDQFPRNMFRGQAAAFSTDALARRIAARAISRGHDLAVDEVARRFFHLPFVHGERLPDQDRGVRLMASRTPRQRLSILHARAHREIIRRFGRFPFRNEALGRKTTEEEARWLEAGGYAQEVRRLSR